MKDLINSIKVQLHERAVSPLFGSYVISWCLWNHKLILILWSSESSSEKLSYIDGTLKFYSTEVFWPNMLIPLLLALAFIFLYPFPARWVYQYNRMQHMKLKKIKQSIDDETPLTQEESRNIRTEIRNIEIKLAEEVDQYNLSLGNIQKEYKNDVVNLNKLISENNVKISELERENRDYSAKNSDQQKRLKYHASKMEGLDNELKETKSKLTRSDVSLAIHKDKIREFDITSFDKKLAAVQKSLEKEIAKNAKIKEIAGKIKQESATKIETEKSLRLAMRKPGVTKKNRKSVDTFTSEVTKLLK